MVQILIVDDSPMECRLTARLLEKRAEWTLTFAMNGRAALDHIIRQPPDVVLSDLHMPEMDGLELLSTIRERFPNIPVVIMTAKGTEEIAMEALRSGAASYVAKKTRSEQLVCVLEMVLAANQRRRDYLHLLETMTERTVEFVIPNDRRLIPPLINYLQEAAVQMGVFGEHERTRIGVALEEALLNALIHGNLEVSSELRLQNDGAYEKLIALRREKDPYRDRKLTVNLGLSPQEVRYTIRDEGPGFDVSHVPDPTLAENLGKPSGRGLLLIRAFLDEVFHNETGNEITLIKRRVENASEQTQKTPLSESAL